MLDFLDKLERIARCDVVRIKISLATGNCREMAYSRC